MCVLTDEEMFLGDNYASGKVRKGRRLLQKGENIDKPAGVEVYY